MSDVQHDRPVPVTTEPRGGLYAAGHVLLALWIAVTAFVYFVRFTAVFVRANAELFEGFLNQLR